VTLFEEYVSDPDIQKDKEVVAKLTAWKAKAKPVRDALKARGIKHQGIIEQFKQAGMLENYVAYRAFCSFTHNQLTTLISRHAGNFELRYHHDAPAETTESTLRV
jgi:hypothetical protein